MPGLLPVPYSSDIPVDVYLAYCASIISLNGPVAIRDCGFGFNRGDGESGGGSYDFVKRVGFDTVADLGVGEKFVRCGCGGADVSCSRVGNSGVGDTEFKGEDHSAGVADVASGGASGGLAVDDGVCAGGASPDSAGSRRSRPGVVVASVREDDVLPRVESKLERNRRWRRERKDRKNQRKGASFDWRKRNDVDPGVRESSMEKWKAQNMLAAERARRDLEVLKANDVDLEVRRYRTKVRSQTERNMVAMEKTHAFLKSTGNVPGVAPSVIPGLDHDVHTVSETISPDSSASQHEFRMCQKKLLDSEKKNADLLAVLAKLGVPALVAENFDKETFTDDTEGNEIYQEMHGHSPDVIHHVVRDGKRKFKVGMDPDALY